MSALGGKRTFVSDPRRQQSLWRIAAALVMVCGEIRRNVMRRCVWLTAAGVATLSFASVSSAQGVMTGIYVLDRERNERVDLAISKGIADVPMPNRALASARLRKFNTPSDGFRGSSPPGRFSIKDDDPPKIVVSTNGDWIRWKLLDGQVFDVYAKMNGDAISLTYRSTKSEPTAVWADSERTTVYHTMGQDLVAENTIIGPQLSTPIRYKLVYKQVR